ncbi:MAG: hypothetical protein GY930_14575 [bacterium]|nr:hypothetical protein [bacterium]
MKESIVSLAAPLERQIYRSRQGDGLLDLLVAAAIIAFGVDRQLDSSLCVVVTLVVGVPLWKVLRERIVEVRLGRVRFSTEREASLRKARQGMVYGLLISMLLGAGTWFLISEHGTHASEMRAPVAVALAALIAGIGVAFEQLRLFAYALFTFAAFCPAGFSGGREVLPRWLIGAGILILLCGIAVFARFLQYNPLGEGEADHDLS